MEKEENPLQLCFASSACAWVGVHMYCSGQYIDPSQPQSTVHCLDCRLPIAEASRFPEKEEGVENVRGVGKTNQWVYS